MLAKWRCSGNSQEAHPPRRGPAQGCHYPPGADHDRGSQAPRSEPEGAVRPGQLQGSLNDGVFTGERVNDVHLTNTDKRTARTTGEKPC